MILEIILRLIISGIIFFVGKKLINMKKDTIEKHIKKIKIPEMITTTVTITSISYTLVLLRYFILYNMMPSNINVEDTLNIMYRSIPYLVVIVIEVVILVWSLYLVILACKQLKKKVFLCKDLKVVKIFYKRILMNQILRKISLLVSNKKLFIDLLFFIIFFIFSIIIDIYFLKGYFIISYSIFQLIYLIIFTLNEEITIIIKKQIAMLIILVPFISSYIPEKSYEIITKENKTLKGILISDTNNKIKIITEVKTNEYFKVTEISKEDVVEIIEHKNEFFIMIPDCVSNDKKICFFFSNKDIIKVNDTDNKIQIITNLIMKEDFENHEKIEKVKKFNLNKNEKYVLKYYNFLKREYKTIKDVEYVDKDINGKNIIYFLKGYGYLCIEINKNDWKNDNLKEISYIIIEKSK